MRPWRRQRLGPRAYEPHVWWLAAAATGKAGARDLAAEAEGRLAEAALYHGVSGQVLAAVRRNPGLLAAATATAIEASHAERMVRAALLRRELGTVGPALASRIGLDPILLKGPAVADRFYADPEERPFEDLDLLVPRECLACAVEALAQIGYHRISVPWPRNLERHSHAVELVRPAGRQTILVELHWRISDDPLADGLDYPGLVAGAAPLPGLHHVLSPAVGEQLLMLAVHLLHHGERRLTWLLDMRAVALAASVEEWQRAFRLADSRQLGWVLHSALELAEHHLGPVRERPSAGRQPASGWGPLRTAHVIGDNMLGYHGGHLATLGWRERPAYLLAGWRSLMRRRSRRLS